LKSQYSAPKKELVRISLSIPQKKIIKTKNLPLESPQDSKNSLFNPSRNSDWPLYPENKTASIPVKNKKNILDFNPTNLI